jgi:hypothetical protein
VQQQINQAICPKHFTSEEWAQQQQLVDEAITLMQSYLESPSGSPELAVIFLSN